VLRAFDPDNVLLPPGERAASWDGVVEVRLDRTPPTSARWTRADGRAARSGRRHIWLNGSFVTAKDEPGDFDACWDTDDVDLDALDPALLDLFNHRAAEKARFGGELFPNVIETQSGLRRVLPERTRQQSQRHRRHPLSKGDAS
jgi:hypothetical protein